jgi:hypothetical protein
MRIKKLVWLYMIGLCYGSPDAHAQSSELLDAIKQVESGGRANVVGDGGKAIGPYQIHRSYWVDACAYDPALAAGKYSDCFNEQYARRVVKAYLRRYGRGKSDEQLARIHNGGPNGHRKSATVGYWNKVQRQMDERN